jgi:hypothetical protein
MKIGPESWLALVAVLFCAFDRNWDCVGVSIVLSGAATALRNLVAGQWRFALLSVGLALGLLYLMGLFV